MSDRLRLFIAAQVALPAVLLFSRVISGEVVGYGWGWQMFS